MTEWFKRLWLFGRRKPESEYRRGYKDTMDFLRSKLGAVPQQRAAYWASACQDEYFDSDGGHYAKGAKAAMRESGMKGPDYHPPGKAV